MNVKHILISIICLLLLINCNTDFSEPSIIKSGFISINIHDGFDFSHDRIIDFRNANGLTVEEKKKAIDIFLYSNIDTTIIRLMGPPLIIDIEPPFFIISPDSTNPSIKNLDVSDINQVSDLSSLSFLPDILLTSIDDVLNKPVFAIITAESNYAIFEITEIDSNFKQISFKWKYQTNGSSEF